MMIGQYKSCKSIVAMGLAALLLAGCGAGGSSSSSEDSGSTSGLSTTSSTSSGSGSSSSGSTTTPTPPVTVAPSTGGTVDASWTIPTSREDGSPLLTSDIQGYEIYYYKSGTPQNQGTVITVNGATQTSHTTGNLSAGTYYFAISSIDNNGVYSQLSNYVAVTVP